MFILQVFFIVALACLTSSSGEGVQPASFCSLPFWELDGDCFYVHDTKLNWHDARHFCTSLSGDNSEETGMATLKDCDQFSIIWQHLSTEFGPDGYWMGGTDEGQEGNWHWVTGESMPMGHPYWIHGEPHKHPEYNCMAYQQNTGYFVSWGCENELYFLCQEY
ncbi:hypothetical protein Pcinc_004374 [Petrolisthes cinctipes]|uniref:C-type lectin domain-containing protein n=1 Tax=Petrolisthes cinctipes TaxID=88211 RepID=A0AAE1GH07_PETCI|nr:hypothetical protein Pcinc_004374 [Petrolisthes cinctipes]